MLLFTFNFSGKTRLVFISLYNYDSINIKY